MNTQAIPHSRGPARHDDRSAAPRGFALSAGGSERSEVLDAAAELLVTDGLAGLTLDAVARRARARPEVICRWWPSEEALALDALQYEWRALAASVRRRAWKHGLRCPDGTGRCRPGT